MSILNWNSPVCFSVISAAALVTGCVEPIEAFNNFEERAIEAGVFRDAEVSLDAGDLRPCTKTDGTQLEFLFSVFTDIAPDAPILLTGAVTFVQGGTAMDVVLQQLSAADGVSPVGAPVMFPRTSLDDSGVFDTGEQPFTIEAEANTIIAGQPFDVTVRLQGGQVCDDGMCVEGIVSGNVPAAMIPLSGGFTAQPISSPSSLPTPRRTCDAP